MKDPGSTYLMQDSHLCSLLQEYTLNTFFKISKNKSYFHKRFPVKYFDTQLCSLANKVFSPVQQALTKISNRH